MFKGLDDRLSSSGNGQGNIEDANAVEMSLCVYNVSDSERTNLLYIIAKIRDPVEAG